MGRAVAQLVGVTAPQDGMFRVLFPVRALEIFKRLIFSVRSQKPCGYSAAGA